MICEDNGGVFKMIISITIDSEDNVIALHDLEGAGDFDLEVTEEYYNNIINKPKPLKYLNGELVVDTVEEEIRTKKLEIEEYKEYLRDTDYVVVKMNEYQLQGQEIESILTQYNDILIEREAKRTLINSLEDEINQLQL